MNIIKNCKECELTSETCNCVCLDLAAAPSPSVPAVESRPTPIFVVQVRGFESACYFADYIPGDSNQLNLVNDFHDSMIMVDLGQLHCVGLFLEVHGYGWCVCDVSSGSPVYCDSLTSFAHGSVDLYLSTEEQSK